MAIYGKALALAIVIALTACSGKYEISVVDKAPHESGAPSAAPTDTEIGENDMESKNQFGGAWPDNEFTRQVPAPEFAVHSVTTNSNSCNITFSDTTIDKLKAYVETLKDAGFATTLTRESGANHYLYTATNAAGYEVVITQSVSYGIMSITRP